MRIFQLFLVLAILLGFLIMHSCTYHKGEIVSVEICDTMDVTYNSGIADIVNSSCTFSGCHEAGAGFGDFTTYTALKEKADGGQLQDRVLDQKNMPPSGYTALTEDQLQLIDCWLQNGAPEN
jgi:hypothetical protein